MGLGAQDIDLVGGPCLGYEVELDFLATVSASPSAQNSTSHSSLAGRIHFHLVTEVLEKKSVRRKNL